MKHAFACLLIAAGAAACAPAEPPPPPPPPPPSTAVLDSLKAVHDNTKSFITRAADQVPEARYSYRPTRTVRTLGQLFAHVADANYMFCGIAGGEKGPETSAEAALKTKDEIVKALAESFAFCDRAYAGLNDETGAAEVTIEAINNMKTTKLGVLSLNTAHDMEHYGNIVTYMRLNNMVPPSSQ